MEHKPVSRPGPEPANLIGRKFGHLTVAAPGEFSTASRRTWSCTCSCGRIKEAGHSALLRGIQRSCGHLRKTHGMSGSKIYQSWSDARSRCTNHNHQHYSKYGGRGITMCPQWASSFEVFLADVGLPPEPTFSLDRINNNGNYEPGNVHWVSRKKQSRNTRRNRHETLGQHTYTRAEWAEIAGIPDRKMRSWLARGKTLEQIAKLLSSNYRLYVARAGRLTADQAQAELLKEGIIELQLRQMEAASDGLLHVYIHEPSGATPESNPEEALFYLSGDLIDLPIDFPAS